MTIDSLFPIVLARIAVLNSAPSPLLPVIFVAAFAILTIGGYVLHSRTLAIAPPSPPAAARPPDACACAALDAAAPLADIDARAYYGCIAAALRSYMAERFALPEHGLPRAETASRLAAAGLAAETAELTAALLARCDAARLGGDAGGADQRSTDLAGAREIIARTTLEGRTHGSASTPR